LSGTSHTLQVEVSYAGLEPNPPSADGRDVGVTAGNSSGVWQQQKAGGSGDIPLGSSTGTIIVNMGIDNVYCAAEFKSDNVSVWIYRIGSNGDRLFEAESYFSIAHTWCGP